MKERDESRGEEEKEKVDGRLACLSTSHLSLIGTYFDEATLPPFRSCVSISDLKDRHADREIARCMLIVKRN